MECDYLHVTGVISCNNKLTSPSFGFSNTGLSYACSIGIPVDIPLVDVTLEGVYHVYLVSRVSNQTLVVLIWVYAGVVNSNFLNSNSIPIRAIVVVGSTVTLRITPPSSATYQCSLLRVG